MNKMERKTLLERIAAEFGFTTECHEEEEKRWGYIDVDTEEWIRIGIKDDRVIIGFQDFYYTEKGWERKFKQQIKIVLCNMKERKIKEMENRNKEIRNCGTNFECA